MNKYFDDLERLESLRALAERLGLAVENYGLLDQAFTHASSLPESSDARRRDNESLEFLGDAVLELAVSHYLYDALPGRTPGEYTRLRASLVNRNTVARVAKQLDIAPLIRLGKGEETGGGRKRSALLADCLEAVIGAAYLDAGWPQARDFVLRAFAAELELICQGTPTWDYKSLLQNYCQARHIALPRFEIVRCEGPDHRKRFEVEVHVSSRPCGRGEGMSKKEAEQCAARQALLELNVLE